MTDSNATLTKRHDAYLGLDVGKESHWGFLVDRDGEVLMSRRVTNTEAALDAALAACPADTLVVVDQHRNIGALAVRRARLAGMPVAYLPGSAEHELAKSFPGIAKTDARDAQVIARSALGMPQTLRPVPEEDPALAGVRIMSAQVATVVKDRTACANALHSRLLESCPAFELSCEMCEPWCAGLLSELGGPWNMLDAGRRRFLSCARRNGAPRGKADALWSSIGGERPPESAVRAEEGYVRMLASRIVADNEAEERLKADIDAELSGCETYRNLLTVPGVGPKTAAQLVASVNIENFESHDKLASYCGLTPATQQSGKSINYDRPHKGGNKTLKNLLMFSCNSLARSKSPLGAYFRKRLERMDYKHALKAVARKRIKVIFAVMRDGVPYAA